MRRTVLSLSLGLSALACGVFAVNSAFAPPQGPCENVFPHEPVVIFEVTGSTLCCPIDFQMTVYSDGLVRGAATAGGSTTSLGATGNAQVGHVTPAQVQSLLVDLGQLGAGTGCDRPELLSDTPLSTLTIIRGSTDSRSRTWSWLGDDGTAGAITQRLQAFRALALPGF